MSDAAPATAPAAPAEGAPTATPAAPPAQAPAGKETAPATEAPKTEEQRFYDLKINGKAEKVPADVLDAAAKALGMEPSELMRGTQLHRAAYAKFEEARKVQQQLEAAQKLDPWDLAKQIRGLKDEDLDRLAEERLIAKLQREAQIASLTPEQQAYEAQRVKFENEKREFERQKVEAEQKAVAEQAAVIRDRLETEVIAGLEAAGMPKTPDAVRAVVTELQRQHKYGIPLDVGAAIRDAQAGFVTPTAAMLGKMPPEKLVALLGKDAYEALLRYSIAQKGADTRPPPGQPPAKPGEPVRKWVTTKEFDELYLK
jgi:hypothetical protein